MCSAPGMWSWRACSAALLLLLFPSCGEQTSGGWVKLADGAASDAQRAQIDRAQRACEVLGKSLLGELTAAITERGAASAIDVCRMRAPEIAGKIGKEQGVRIGRTSQRLRNPANTTPAWAAPTLAVGEPSAARFVGPDGSVGVLQPIVLMPLCTQCHGPADQLAKGVGEALARLYPGDRAIGFAPGDLRGWFWVEVPHP